MKKRYSVIPELELLEGEFGKSKPRMAGIIQQIIYLLDPETTLNETQLKEVLYLFHTESERQKSTCGVVTRMTQLINNLYLTHLLTGGK